ncbi:MAG: nicotinate phosphoribosyltransferase [Lactobacillus sp.]|jgi:nicotinate phosphoribosyltransferase|nr:nicotinate phosphoribosyltransferase [Lactobacillus sp.]MCI2032042.1 nicotinate phosphoribosyltransferase [Lactobacillus sp.]
MTYKDDGLALHTDFYELNMMYTYWKQGIAERNAIFEVYFRDLPFGSGFAVFAGLEHMVEYLKGLQFTDSDIDYLSEVTNYPQAFLDYLHDLKFTGTLRSAVEGDLVFNNEPIVQFEGPLAQGQLIETAILNMVNYQTLVATKAARIRAVVGNDPLMEFGTRRAQETSAAMWGTRAAFIGGFNATSNVRAGKVFGIPISGTHAHALVQAYRDDYDAFKAYAEVNHDVTFLVDTYDTLRSGVPAAIRVAQEMGDKIDFQGVRIDSGDMAYISKRVRQQLDAAGFTDTKIVASNDLDENTIQNLKMQGAKIDTWGVGTKVITAYDHPALGAVYKLVSIEDEHGEMADTIKLSANAEKVSTPGKKQVWRITRHSNGKSEGDYVALAYEDIANQDSLYMFHPNFTYINKTVRDFDARPLLRTIFDQGKLVYDLPALVDVREYAMQSVDSLWDEYTRVLNPQEYPVDLSQAAWDNKMSIIKRIKEKVNWHQA